ncbi:MAG: Re/Si-specific NAD(P)(+) transhydrogenase subunit alpha [Acidobacteriota bacterium]|nr:Re/Si-specific NAD(P)(+) transhydrogenase subunit alpha [Acidobacteriota bacterium]
MRVFVPKERHPEERRVAATPETVKKLVRSGFECVVESGAGTDSDLPDDAYRKVGATIDTSGTAWREADVVLKVSPPTAEEAAKSRPQTVIIGFFEPQQNVGVVSTLAKNNVTTLAMELIPRITRAQSMDALSSQASIGGYKAVVLAASRLGRYFPLLMTAAGTVPPAKVVILGAGVAGLQALATAKRLGAVVEVSDIRPAVKEQIESLGGKFIDLPEQVDAEDAGGYAKEMGEDFLQRQREILTQHLATANVVITTAQIPGKKAPMLMSRQMVEAMHPGAIIVDMAAASGGNCELTELGEEVVHNGVLILGPASLPATMAHDASLLYSRNVLALVEHMLTDGKLEIDPQDDVLSGALLTHAGAILHAPTSALVEEVSS